MATYIVTADSQKPVAYSEIEKAIQAVVTLAEHGIRAVITLVGNVRDAINRLDEYARQRDIHISLDKEHSDPETIEYLRGAFFGGIAGGALGAAGGAAVAAAMARGGATAGSAAGAVAGPPGAVTGALVGALIGVTLGVAISAVAVKLGVRVRYAAQPASADAAPGVYDGDRPIDVEFVPHA